jgi:DNA-binding NarL/FixJ family response regulator
MTLLLVAPVMTLSMIAQRLRRYGHHIVAVASALEGSALHDRFDVAVVDLALGDHDALDVARRLLARGQVARVVFFGDVESSTFRRRADQFGVVVERREGIAALAHVLTEMRPRLDSGLDLVSARNDVQAKTS